MAKVKLSEFLDDVEELHALVIGLCEVLCPWPPRYNNADSCPDCLKGEEYHYYVLGRAIGVIAWLGIAAAIKKIFF